MLWRDIKPINTAWEKFVLRQWVVEFLLVLIELFSVGFTAEALRANIS